MDAAPVTAAKPKRVSVKMMHRTVAHYNTDKSPVEAYFDRQLTYVMEPAAKGAWKLAQYEGPYTVESYSLLR